jgi:hypothetical protein
MEEEEGALSLLPWTSGRVENKTRFPKRRTTLPETSDTPRNRELQVPDDNVWNDPGEHQSVLYAINTHTCGYHSHCFLQLGTQNMKTPQAMQSRSHVLLQQTCPTRTSGMDLPELNRYTMFTGKERTRLSRLRKGRSYDELGKKGAGRRRTASIRAQWRIDG